MPTSSIPVFNKLKGPPGALLDGRAIGQGFDAPTVIRVRRMHLQPGTRDHHRGVDVLLITLVRRLFQPDLHYLLFKSGLVGFTDVAGASDSSRDRRQLA